MTLVVSLRVPDGVVLAADSLTNVPGSRVPHMAYKTACPECGAEAVQQIDGELFTRVRCNSCTLQTHAPVMVRAQQLTESTASYAQKIIPFLGRFGIGIAGANVLGTRTVFSHLKELERTLRGTAGAGVTEIAKQIHAFITERVANAAELHPPDGPLIMQIVGFDSIEDATGKTFLASWDGDGTSLELDGDGRYLTYSGEPRIIEAFAMALKSERMVPNPWVFSLQDAVDYAEFLVNLTATVQRFALKVPTVGGEVDVALVTPYAGFQWVKAKALTRQLEPPAGF